MSQPAVRVRNPDLIRVKRCNSVTDSESLDGRGNVPVLELFLCAFPVFALSPEV